MISEKEPALGGGAQDNSPRLGGDKGLRYNSDIYLMLHQTLRVFVIVVGPLLRATVSDEEIRRLVRETFTGAWEKGLSEMPDLRGSWEGWDALPIVVDEELPESHVRYGGQDAMADL